MVEYEIEDPITHETHTGETLTLYDQPISSNGKFKVVKWNNIPDNPFYDGLLGEGLVLRKITETEQTTDRDWDVHINVQPNLYALNLGTMSTNTNGVITRTPQEFGYDYYGFSSVSYEIDIKNGELNIGTIRANTNNTAVTLLPSSYNWQYFNKVKYIVDVPQGITTNQFNTIRSNSTYRLSQLYTGNDNPVAFKPDSQITVKVDPPVLSVGPLNLGSLTDNTTQTITIDPNDYHYDYFNLVSYSVNVPKPITTTFNTIIANSTQNYTLNDLYIGQDNPVGFKPDSVIPVLVDHHLISNDTFTITATSNDQTYTIEQLMQLNQYSPASYNGLSKTCSIRVQVPENLETLTNKRLQSEQTYTISNLMQDPTNNIGITKNSTLIVDLPGYPPTTSQKILNLVSNTTSPRTIYPKSGEYWNSIRYSVNVSNIVNYDPSKFTVESSDNTSRNFNKQPINWSYNLGGNAWGIVINNDRRNIIIIHFNSVEDGSDWTMKVDDTTNATGNYCYEQTGTGSNIQLKYNGEWIASFFPENNSTPNAENNHFYFSLPRSQMIL